MLRPLVLFAFASTSPATAAAAFAAAFPAFVPLSLADSAAGLSAFREAISPADLDGDGDLDFYSGEGRGGKEWWFENRGATRFQAHLVSDSNDADVGAAVADVDGDGDMDRLAGGFLYRHPGVAALGTRTFAVERTGAQEYTHDLLVADFDRDGRPDFVVIDYGGIWWHRNPGLAGAPWPAVTVAGPDPKGQHGGLAVGDFDGDGDADIARVDTWYENREGGKTWVKRPGPDFGQWDPTLYGLSARTVVHDMDGDGDQDLLQAECDVRNGRIAWFENREGGGTWVTRLVKDSTDGQDFHSLGLADFDGDGDLDIFSCGALLSRDPPRWYIWENKDGKFGALEEHVLASGGRSGHEAVAFDADGDGDIDLLGKAFNGPHALLVNTRLGTLGIRSAAPGRVGTGRLRGNRKHTPWFWVPWGAIGPVDALGRTPP
jgi:hypothetical protein